MWCLWYPGQPEGVCWGEGVTLPLSGHWYGFCRQAGNCGGVQGYWVQDDQSQGVQSWWGEGSRGIRRITLWISYSNFLLRWKNCWLVELHTFPGQAMVLSMLLIWQCQHRNMPSFLTNLMVVSSGTAFSIFLTSGLESQPLHGWWEWCLAAWR